MRKTLAIIVGLLALLSTAPPASAGVRVSATVDRTRVAPGESLMLRIAIQGEGGEVDLTALTDFEVLSRGSSSNFQIVDGRMSREVTYTYMILPRHQGRLSIPALAVDVDGRQYLTDPIDVEVTARPAEDTDKADADVWVSAEVSNTAPVQGEQITYTFRFHRAVQTNDARFQQPDFKGFSAKEIEDRHNYKTIVNGREIVVTELYFVLVPMETGTQIIEPATIQVGVADRGQGRGRSPLDDFFGRRFFRPRVLQTEAIEVRVQPLPPWQGSPAFSGLVGRFELSADLEKTRLKVGDSATLSLILEGRGNLMDARMPAIPFPAGLKEYRDSPEEKIQLGPEGYHGRKVFRTALVPVAAGDIRFSPVRLVYFDTEDHQYRTLTARLPELSVLPGEGPGDTKVAVAPDPLALAKQRVKFTGRDILPPKENLEAIRSRKAMAGGWFLLALFAPAALFVATAAVQRMRRKEQTPMARMRIRSRQALKRAAGQSGRRRLGHLYQALTAAILASSGRTGEALTWKEAETLLLGQGRTPEEARESADLLAAIESSKFGAETIADGEQERLLEQTRKIVRMLTG